MQQEMTLTINRKKARTKSSLQGERNKPDELEEFLLAKVILQIKDLLKKRPRRA